MAWKNHSPGCKCCDGCRCDLVDCYTNDALDGQGCVNETEFVLTNIPASIALWNYTPPNNLVFPPAPQFFYKYIIKSPVPTAYGGSVTAAEINGTYVYQRFDTPSPGINCRFPFLDLAQPDPYLTFSVVADVEQYFQNPFNSTTLQLNRTTENKVVELMFMPIHDEAVSLGPATGLSSLHLSVKPVDWYMHYIAINIDGRASNPICAIPTAQATCGTSELSWVTEPFIELPYPYSQSLDWSAYRNTYAIGSTAESFA